MFFDEVKPLAQFECSANGLAVVFGDAEQAIDAAIALGIFDAAGTDDRRERGLRGGRDLDTVDVELTVQRRRAVRVNAQHKITRDRGERRRKLRCEFGVCR
jgi:hypothetical protein